MLKLRHLSKSYVAGKPVLTDINLEVAARGVAAVIGPSGTGKSTLIRCINRLVEPSEGEILFDGQDLAKLSRADSFSYVDLSNAWPEPFATARTTSQLVL